MADFGVIVGLDVTSSAKEIRDVGIPKLKKELDADTSARLQLIGQLDTTKTHDTIKAQLDGIAKSLTGNKINLEVGINTTSIQNGIKDAVAKSSKSVSDSAVIKPTVDIKSVDDAFKLLKQKYLEVSGVGASSSPFKALELVIQKVSERIKGLEIKPEGLSQFVNAISKVQNPQGIIAVLNTFDKLDKGTTKASESAKQYEQALQSVLGAGSSLSSKLGQITSGETKSVQSTTDAYEQQNKVLEANKKLKETAYYDKNQKLTGTTTINQVGATGSTLTTYRDGVGAPTGYVLTENYQAMAKALAQAETNAIKLTTRLEDVKSKYEDINVSKPIKDDGHIAQLTAQYEKAVSAIGNVKTADANSMSVMKANAESEISALERLVTQYRNAEYAANQLRTKDIGTVKNIESSNIDKLVNSLTKAGVPMGNLNQEITKLKQTLTSVSDKEGLVNYLNQFDILKSKAENIKTVYSEIKSVIDSLNKAVNNTQFKQNPNNSNVLALKTQISGLQAEYQKLLNSLANAGSPEAITRISTELNGLKSKFVSATASAKNLQETLKDSKADDNLSTKIRVLTNQLIAFKNANSKAMNSTKLSSNGLTFSAEIDSMLAKLKQCADPTVYNQVANNFKVIKNEVTALGLKGADFLGSLWANVKKFASWMGMTTAMSRAAMEVRRFFTTVVDLDTVLIDLKKTFKGTDSELNQFYYDANKTAKVVGVTTEEIISQASAWSRLGYSTAEAATEMAKLSSMFATISPDMDTEQATDGLVSIMKAFDYDPNEVLDGVISKINEIGNTAATTNGEIVTMLEKSSSAMKEANNSLEETIALETAAVEITRDADSVGTAFKTVSMRIRGKSLPPYTVMYMLCA